MSFTASAAVLAHMLLSEPATYIFCMSFIVYRLPPLSLSAAVWPLQDIDIANILLIIYIAIKGVVGKIYCAIL